MFQITRQITEAELEPVYNHVHHADSLYFLEEARLEYLNALGLPRQRYLELGLFWVIAEVHVRYLRELTAGPVVVTCEQGPIDDKRLHLKQSVINAKGKPAIEAETVSMLLSKKTGRSARIPQEFWDAFHNWSQKRL